MLGGGGGNKRPKVWVCVGICARCALRCYLSEEGSNSSEAEHTVAAFSWVRGGSGLWSSQPISSRLAISPEHALRADVVLREWGEGSMSPCPFEPATGSSSDGDIPPRAVGNVETRDAPRRCSPTPSSSAFGRRVVLRLDRLDSHRAQCDHSSGVTQTRTCHAPLLEPE